MLRPPWEMSPGRGFCSPAQPTLREARARRGWQGRAVPGLSDPPVGRSSRNRAFSPGAGAVCVFYGVSLTHSVTRAPWSLGFWKGKCIWRDVVSGDRGRPGSQNLRGEGVSTGRLGRKGVGCRWSVRPRLQQSGSSVPRGHCPAPVLSRLRPSVSEGMSWALGGLPWRSRPWCRGPGGTQSLAPPGVSLAPLQYNLSSPGNPQCPSCFVSVGHEGHLQGPSGSVAVSAICSHGATLPG